MYKNCIPSFISPRFPLRLTSDCMSCNFQREQKCRRSEEHRNSQYKTSISEVAEVVFEDFTELSRRRLNWINQVNVSAQHTRGRKQQMSHSVCITHQHIRLLCIALSLQVCHFQNIPKNLLTNFIEGSV